MTTLEDARKCIEHCVRAEEGSRFEVALIFRDASQSILDEDRSRHLDTLRKRRDAAEEEAKAQTKKAAELAEELRQLGAPGRPIKKPRKSKPRKPKPEAQPSLLGVTE